VETDIKGLFMRGQRKMQQLCQKIIIMEIQEDNGDGGKYLTFIKCTNNNSKNNIPLFPLAKIFIKDFLVFLL
jgi:hypothetical protein